MDNQFVKCVIEEGIALVSIDNPASLNALNAPTLTQLDQVFNQLEEGKNPSWPEPISTNSSR
jgi:enoyl-CoA hydratase/carnithine racemase